jgi:hypothetical protein
MISIFVSRPVATGNRAQNDKIVLLTDRRLYLTTGARRPREEALWSLMSVGQTLAETVAAHIHVYTATYTKRLAIG